MRTLRSGLLIGVLAAGPALAAPTGRPAPAAKPAVAPASADQERRDLEELAELYAQEGRTDDALAVYADLRARAPSTVEYWRRAADLLEPLPDRQAELLSLLEAWRAAAPTLREPAERLARFYEQDGAIDEGLAIVAGLLAQTPRDPAVLRLRAELLETGDRTDAAIAAWAAVLALPGATLEDRWRHAELSSTRGDTPELRAAYAGLVEARPNDVRFRVAYGEALLGADDVPGARRQADAAEALAPGTPDVRRLLDAVAAAEAERSADRRQDDDETRGALRRRLDRAARVRALSREEDY
jgi:predicted Zn-dependent protease